MRNRAISFVVITTAALLGGASPSFAQGIGIGVRAGASVDPDQFYLGAHVETGAIVNRVHLRPNLEIGFGDDVTLVAVNIEAVYRFPLHQSPWTVYGGGGPAINYYNFDEDRDSDTRGGFKLRGRAPARQGAVLRSEDRGVGQPRPQVRRGLRLRTVGDGEG